jgi:hypothetical protein
VSRKFFPFIFMLICLLLIVVPIYAQDELYQWASYAEASSEYGDGDSWSAMQATGEPDTDDCGDAESAWASETTDDPDEYLSVYFDEPVFPTEINIYQTYNPGSIIGIELIAWEDGEAITMRDLPDSETDCPGIYTVPVIWANPVAIYGLTIYLDQTDMDGWTEIDAVELVGEPLEAMGFNSGDDEEDEGDDNSSSSNTIMGRTVNCDSGARFDNGIEVRAVQLRAGFTYTATAIGINGFDPVLAVLNSQGRGLCTDDDSVAAQYSAWLPTTGEVRPSATSSRITFANNSSSTFTDISLIVGGLDNQTGEFILILEGMVLSSADGIGDVFAVQLTPGLIASDVPPTAYMMGAVAGLDPQISRVNQNYDYIQDTNNAYITCDNAGYTSCWGSSSDLANGYYVSRSSGYISGDSYDAMLSVPTQTGQDWYFYSYAMQSAGLDTFGDYIVAFHLGIGD